jgi:hypothetical protein
MEKLLLVQVYRVLCMEKCLSGRISVGLVK